VPSPLPRTVIALSKESSLSVIYGCVRKLDSAEPYYFGSLDFILKPKARLSYTSVQSWPSHVFRNACQRAYLSDGAELEWIDGDLGARWLKKSPQVFFDG